MACEFEIKQNEDFRQQLFAKQEELLGILKEAWKLRKQKEYQRKIKLPPLKARQKLSGPIKKVDAVFLVDGSHISFSSL